MKRALFLCVQNSCRSQMAEGFGQLYKGAEWEIYSAGSSPSGTIHPRAIEVMKERHLDLSRQSSKSQSSLSKISFDVVVSMGCGDLCPTAPGGRVLQWDIPDPKDMDLEGFRKVRDLLDQKVKELLSRLS